MPSWNEILKEMHDCRRKDAHDFIRNKYLQELQKKSERNIICYYSGWLQKPRFASAHIDDNDKNALMAAVHRLNRKIGLDLVLHTPGGDLAAAESLVD